MNIKNILANIPFFKGLNPEYFENLAKRSVIKTFQKGEILFSEYEKADILYIVVRGKVKIYKLSEEGNEHILHIHRDKDIIAEAAVFDKGVYPAYCIAVQETKVICISKNSLTDFIKENPEAVFMLIASYSKRLREFVDKIEYLSLKDVKERLLTYFLKNAVNENNKRVCKLEISKKELGLFLGTTPETVSRNIKKLIDCGQIEQLSNNYYILN